MTDIARVSARTTNIDFDKVYGTKYCIPTWLRDEQIRAACRKVKGRIQASEEVRTDPVAVVGYGPSLQDTWEELRGFKYIISCSGAHRFLIDRGIIPTWHVEVDPREHKIQLLGEPHKGVTYLPSSTSHPKYLDHLLKAGVDVRLWHVFTQDEGATVLPPGEWALTGGADAGLRSLVVARFFGFVDIHAFGLDGCGRDSSHAGQHPNSPGKLFDCEYPKGSGKVWKTTPALMSCAKAFPHEVDQLKDAKVTFHGEGLIQTIMQSHVPQKPKEGLLALAKPEVITAGYAALNARMHDENPLYGTSGVKYVDTVLKLARSLNTTSVLDYGCGKGLLGRKMPFPIWEYDPAIPGKTEQPRRADLVVCTDVLEHVEPERIGAVLADLARVTGKVGYFVIHTGAARKVLPDGRNAHLIQQPAKWWAKALGAYFTIGRVLQVGPQLHVVVGPRSMKKAKQAQPARAHKRFMRVYEYAQRVRRTRLWSFLGDLRATVRCALRDTSDYTVRAPLA